jgi:hypothetical protein
MFGGRIKSALFIDFENVRDLCPSDKIAHWVHWLEDGEFDEKRRRRLVKKNIYWGPADRRHEEAFEQQGFNVVLCEKFKMLKNSADIALAIDVAEAVLRQPKIEEFIIFSMDTDYVPVIKRLEIANKRSAILVNEDQERVFGVYHSRVDTVITVRDFRSAPSYSRTSRWTRAKQAAAVLSERISGSLRREAAGPQLSTVGTLTEPVSAPIPVRKMLEEERREGKGSRRKARAGAEIRLPWARGAKRKAGGLDAAARVLIRVTELKPNKYTAKKDIEAKLAGSVSGFRTRGPGRYMGHGMFGGLMKVLKPRTDGRIEVVDEPNGGVSVKYVPKDDD